jgi:hypothetical protein
MRSIFISLLPQPPKGDFLPTTFGGFGLRKKHIRPPPRGHYNFKWMLATIYVFLRHRTFIQIELLIQQWKHPS